LRQQGEPMVRTSPTGKVTPHIRRHLNEEEWTHHRDLSFLADMARKSHGDLWFAIREHRVSLYHQGKLVCTVNFVPRTGRAASTYPRPYNVGFGRRFTEPTKPKSGWAPLGEWDLADQIDDLAGCKGRRSGSYSYYNLDAAGLKRVITPAVVKRLCAAIRAINYGGEITFEQLLVAQNPPRPDFLVIDRQIADSHPKFARQRMDVLALRRVAGDEFSFVVIELKLGNNPAAWGEVVGQTKRYVDHIEHDVAEEYCATYAKMYEQLAQFGLIGSEMPRTITIRPDRPEGVVVIGYADKALEEHVKTLREDNPDIHFHTPELRLS